MEKEIGYKRVICKHCGFMPWDTTSIEKCEHCGCVEFWLYEYEIYVDPGKPMFAETWRQSQ